MIALRNAPLTLACSIEGACALTGGTICAGSFGEGASTASSAAPQAGAVTDTWAARGHTDWFQCVLRSATGDALTAVAGHLAGALFGGSLPGSLCTPCSEQYEWGRISGCV